MRPFLIKNYNTFNAMIQEEFYEAANEQFDDQDAGETREKLEALKQGMNVMFEAEIKHAKANESEKRGTDVETGSVRSSNSNAM